MYRVDLTAFIAGALKAVAVGAMIGGGTMVLQTAQQNAVQSEQILRLQDTQMEVLSRIDSLKTSIDLANTNFAQLNGYLEGKGYVSETKSSHRR